jgi:hypothetical protein
VRFYENRYMGPWMNAPGTAMPWYMTPGAMQSPYFQQGTDPMYSGALAYPMIYPDIYYKLQPYIINAADRMEMYGGMPAEQMIDRMVDEIREEVMKIHPEIGEYAREYTENMPGRMENMPGRMENMPGRMENMFGREEENAPAQTFPGRYQDYMGTEMHDGEDGMLGRGSPFHPDPPRFESSAIFPRRGLFNDLIRILLLSEFHRRRRRRFY